MTSIQAFGLTVAFLLLACGGVVTTLQEGKAVFNTTPDVEETFHALMDGGLRPGLSIESKQSVLETCYQLMVSLFAEAQPTTTRRALLDRCSEIVNGVIASVPTHGYAPIVRALIAGQEGDYVAFNEALVAAQRMAPFEGGLAQARVLLAGWQESHLTSAAQAAYAADLRVVVSSRAGVSLIANRYVNEPALREQITAIVETLPEDAQSRFVSYVGAAAAQKADTP